VSVTEIECGSHAYDANSDHNRTLKYVLTRQFDKEGQNLMKVKGCMIFFLLMLSILITNPAYAEYSNGKCIFAEDLAVGSILTGFNVSGNGVYNVSKEAVVVHAGKAPRLVVTTNQGAYHKKFSTDGSNNYKSSYLKSIVDSCTFNIDEYVFNVSAPSIKDIVGSFGSSDTWSENYGFVNLGELKGDYWTCTPFPLNYHVWQAYYVMDNGMVNRIYVDYSHGIRLAFNLKQDTVLKYNSGKFTITSSQTDIQKAFESKYGDLYSASIDARNAANSAKTSAQQAKSSADAAAGDADYIRNTQLPTVENKIDNLETKVANIENNMSTGDSAPPTITSVKGYNGATCTTGTTFKVVVKASDNSSDSLEFRVKADSGSWSNWTSISNYAVATGISGGGAHTISVEVRDQAGNASNDTMTVFKI